MIKRIKLTFLFLIAGALFAVCYRSSPPANAGGSDRHPVASTTPRGLPARGPRSALGTDKTPPTDAGGTDADFAAHVEQLKKKLPSTAFTIVVQKPFVVIGDEPADDVREHSLRTVKWPSTN
jgi:hypothetical protein